MLDVKKIIDSFDTLTPLPMKKHPRLFVDTDAIARVKLSTETPLRKHAQAYVEAEAERLLNDIEIKNDMTHHNAHLIRAEMMQAEVFTLLVRYFQTGEEKYRLRVLDCIREMDHWEHWSWFEWRANAEPDRDAEFVSYDLSYGENSMTLAVAYDTLYDTLSTEEKKLFFDVLKHHRVITEFLRHVRLGPGCARDSAGWIQNEKCNWLAVTCGGMGLLALAFYDELEEARQALALCDPAVMTLMEFLDTCGGSWPEGLSYFAYTMRYAVPYLLSYEIATGKKHPAFDLTGTKESNSFLLNLQPKGHPCTFGDDNERWDTHGFQYMLCRKYERSDLFSLLDAQAKLDDNIYQCWPIHAERLLFAEPNPEPCTDKKESVVFLYPGTNYGVIADVLPDPDFCMVIRGGNTNGDHEHNDLSSFHLVSGGEHFIESITTDLYLDTTFSSRRNDLYEMTPAAKNVMLINGVGMVMYSEIEQKLITCDGYQGIRLNCTPAMGKVTCNFDAVKAYHRTFLQLAKDAILIIDDASLPNPGRFDARLHTYTDVCPLENGFLMTSPDDPSNQLRIVYSASEASVQKLSADVPTLPRKLTAIPRYNTKSSIKDSALMRYCSKALVNEYVLATLLTKDTSADVKLRCTSEEIRVQAEVHGISHQIVMNR